jgi:hypothetical protein
MLINYKEIESLHWRNFLKMSSEEFDLYMCQTYTEIFQDRNKSMDLTCMCWGFDIGPGWYPYLDSLCKKITAISEITGIKVIASQIKSKFGSARFYYDLRIETPKINKKDIEIFSDIISEMVNTFEESSYNICSECGQYYKTKVISGSWVNDQCSKCLRRLKEGEEVTDEQDGDWSGIDDGSVSRETP